MGGLAIVHNEQLTDPTVLFQSTCPVRLVNFAREDIHRSFDYLKERMFIRRKSPDDRPVIYTTGIGGSQYMKQIRDEFRVE